MNSEQVMTKYTTTFTVTKSFEVEVVFEAPNAQIATEMASDMADDDIISNRCDSDGIVESVELDFDPTEAKYQTVKVDRSIQRWCNRWLKDSVKGV